MALNKQQTRLLWIAFALAAAVALAIGTVLWLFPSRKIPEDAPFELITSQQSDRLMGATVRRGVTGDPSGWDLPLPLYSFTPGPEWTQIQDAAQTANVLSYSYQDVYQNAQGDYLTFNQKIAIQQEHVNAQHTTTVGDTLILFSQGEDPGGVTSITWMEGNSLLNLIWDRVVSENQMLELFEQVDPDTLRQPVYTPLTMQLTSGEGYQTCVFQGNPEIPQDYQFCGFSQPPRGYELEEVMGQYDYFPSGSTDNLVRFYYQSGGLRRLELSCWLGEEYAALAFPTDRAEDVQPVTVNGNPGLLYCGANSWGIAWTDQYRALCLTSSQYITPELLLELAQQVRPLEDSQGLIKTTQAH